MENKDVKRPINVLHILDMAGGSSIQSHFYKKLGFGKSWVLYHKKPHPVIDYYNEVEEFLRFRNVIWEGLKRSRKSEVDIILIHGGEILVPIFKLFSRKKIVLQYHGSDVNEPKRSRNIFRIIARSMADTIIYNQKAHKEKIITIKKVPMQYHVNAVDTELFSKKKIIKKGNLAFLSSNLNNKKTMKLLEDFNDLTIIDTQKNGRIPYGKLSDVLNKYKMFIDLKITTYDLLVPTLSMLALQSLACGCKVYTFEKEIKEGLPERHKPEIAIKKLFDLFQSLLEK